MFFGELGLDGRLRPVRGVLPAVAGAANEGFRHVMVAEQNAAEAALVPGVRVIAASSLTVAADWLRGLPGPDGGLAAAEYEGGAELPDTGTPSPPGRDAAESGRPSRGGFAQAADRGNSMTPDLAEMLGQSMARRAAEVCAAGGHHLSLLGPPGAGKTMLAERIPTILPRLDTPAALEVTAIHSIAGMLPARVPLLTDPPFLAPHHTATKAAIVGGGSGVIRPGSASLAHRGVLFLDEAPEFARDVLDALRQPLEAGEVVVARSGVTARFPARFTLVLASNPCPCARVAYGIDAAAHRGALAAEAITVAVLACGVDYPYPAGHADLFQAITAQGLVISEWPPGRHPARMRFLVRNRVIAALACGTVIVEAGERSGALNTARHAADLGQPLMAVPGPVTSAQSAGCHRIIREWGATCVTRADDIIEMLSPLSIPDALAPGGGPEPPDSGSPGSPPEPSRDGLDADSARVLDALPARGGAGTSTIAVAAGVDLDTVLRCLGRLAGYGFIERGDGGWRLRRPDRPVRPR
jgi:DNA protecting protein DprA